MTWDQLCAESERRFGHPGARVYPLMTLQPLNDDTTPIVRTKFGPARILAVVNTEEHGRNEDLVEVVLESDLRRFRTAKAASEEPQPLRVRILSPERVHPPCSPPPSWKLLTYGVPHG